MSKFIASICTNSILSTNKTEVVESKVPLEETSSTSSIKLNSLKTVLTLATALIVNVFVIVWFKLFSVVVLVTIKSPFVKLFTKVGSFE